MPCVKTKGGEWPLPKALGATSPLCVAASGSACREAPSLALACWIPKVTASSPRHPLSSGLCGGPSPQQGTPSHVRMMASRPSCCLSERCVLVAL